MSEPGNEGWGKPGPERCSAVAAALRLAGPASPAALFLPRFCQWKGWAPLCCPCPPPYCPSLTSGPWRMHQFWPGYQPSSGVPALPSPLIGYCTKEANWADDHPHQVLPTYPLETSHQEPQGSSRPLLQSPVLLTQLQPCTPHLDGPGTSGTLSVNSSAQDMWSGVTVRNPTLGWRIYLVGHFQALSSNMHTHSFFSLYLTPKLPLFLAL